MHKVRNPPLAPSLLYPFTGTPGQVPPGDKSTSSARLGTLAESLSKMNGYGRFLQVRRRIYEITAWRPDSRDKEGRYGAVQY